MESKINYLRENYKSTKNYIVTWEHSYIPKQVYVFLIYTLYRIKQYCIIQKQCRLHVFNDTI